MKKTELMMKASRAFHKAGFKLKKRSPEILIAAGVVGTVTSAVMACKATTKVSRIIEEKNEQMDRIHKSAEAGEIRTKRGIEEYTAEDAKKDTAIIYTQTGMRFVKLYGPSIALGALSLGCIITSNQILRKRNVALAAAYATIDKSFKEYRGRVVERFGKDLDRELRYNIKAKEVEVETVGEDGKVTKEMKTVQMLDPNTYSDYARVFDCGNVGWDEDPEFRLMFLKHQQNYANDLLKSRGYLFLNEVYDMLGIPRTKAGQCVGWVYDEKHPMGDNFVDFNIYNVNSPKACDFVNGREQAIVLDFNVDGDILNSL